MLEGLDGGANELSAFLNTHRTTIEAWVNTGGSLLINSAGNEGGDINYGFGGVTNRSYQGSGSLQPNVTVVFATLATTPFSVGTAFGGNFFGHGYITGPGMTNLINGSGPTEPVLTEKAFGAGNVMFGNMTTTNWHNPQPNADQLLANIMAYGASQCGQVCVPTLDNYPASLNVNNDNGQCGANVS